MAIKNGNDIETRACCDYCGSDIKLKWTEGALPNCPNCGAQLREVVDKSIIEEKLKDVPSQSSGRRGRSGGMIGVMALIVAFGMIPFTLFSLFSGSDDSPAEDTTVVQYEEDSIYVNELGRTCYLDTESGYYYDKETDCYFWFNEDTDQWQYWFEGLSSDYGDYGWMEYDYDQRLWFIEVGEDSWEVLPEKYDTSSLWHMQILGTGRFNDQDSYYVEEIDRTCEWNDDERGYVDDETGCIFWYNDEVDPPIWQYWYDGISSDYGDYGSMEYDEGEGCWYIETSYGNWEKVPDSCDTSNCWHIVE